MEIFIERIVQVQTQQCLALHAEGRLVFKRHTNVGSCINQALVGDGHRSHVVIHSIVAVLSQWHTACGHNHRPARHIHRIQLNGIARRRLILTLKHKLVLVLILASHGQRRVIEFGIHIVLGDVLVSNGIGKETAKRLYHREDDPTL